MSAKDLKMLQYSIKAFKNLVHGLEDIKIFTEDLIENGPYFLAIFNVECTVLKINKVAADLLNLETEKAVGHNLDEFKIGMSEKQAIKDNIKKAFALKSSEPISFDASFTKGEDSVYFDLKAQKIGEELNLDENLVLIVGTDVSALKQLMDEKVKTTELTYLAEIAQRQLETTTEIQQMLIPELSKDEVNYKLRVTYRPSEYCSGDFWWKRDANNRNIIIVCDVMGHGVASGMLGSFMNGYIQCFFDSNEQISRKLIEGLSQKISDLTRHSYSSTFGAVEVEKNICRFWNCGGVFPNIVNKEGEVVNLNMRSNLLGMGKLSIDTVEIPREEVKRIMWHTDGFGDFRKNDRLMSRRKIVNFIKEISGMQIDEASQNVEKFIEEVSETYEILDDISFVIIDL